MLTVVIEPDCDRPAVVELEDLTGDRRWGCLLHARRAMRHVVGLMVVDSVTSEVSRG